MKEVAEELGLSDDTIRYYERIGLLQVSRDKNGYRRFDQQAIEGANCSTRSRVGDAES
ncbi:MerR family DNA-binding transcriptional regulator [Streptococcus suis]|nr:MerR family DNA-binding transcriptional regulator [Streptococcus suis]